jgi:hypothetical protein
MSKAWDTALAHCLKYAGQDVYGFIVSNTQNQTEHCIPLFHSPCVSVPLVRTALSLVDELENVSITGVYFATNYLEGPTPLLRLIHSTLSEVLKGSIAVWRFDDAMGEKEGGDVRFSSFALNQPNGNQQNLVRTVSDISSFRDMVATDSYFSYVVDFEDFLADPAREWISV